MDANNTGPLIAGSVTVRNRWSAPAPSTIAASWSDRGTSCSALTMMITMNGYASHTSVVTYAKNASQRPLRKPIGTSKRRSSGPTATT